MLLPVVILAGLFVPTDAGSIRIINYSSHAVDYKITALHSQIVCEGAMVPGPSESFCHCTPNVNHHFHSRRTEVRSQKSLVSEISRDIHTVLDSCSDLNTIRSCTSGPYICTITADNLCVCTNSGVDGDKDIGDEEKDIRVVKEPFVGAVSQYSSKVAKYLGRSIAESVLQTTSMSMSMSPTAVLLSAVQSATNPFGYITFPFSVMVTIAINSNQEVRRMYQESRLPGVISFLAAALGGHNVVKEHVNPSYPILQCFKEIAEVYEGSAKRIGGELVRSFGPGYFAANEDDPFESGLRDSIERDLASTGFMTRFLGLLTQSKDKPLMRLSYSRLNLLIQAIVSELHSVLFYDNYKAVKKFLARELDKFFEHRRIKILYGTLGVIGIRPNVHRIKDSKTLLKHYERLPVIVSGDCGRPHTAVSSTSSLRDRVGTKVMSAVDQRELLEVLSGDSGENRSFLGPGDDKTEFAPHTLSKNDYDEDEATNEYELDSGNIGMREKREHLFEDTTELEQK